MVQKRAEGVSQVHSEVKGLVHVSVTSVSEVILDDPVQTAEEYKRNSVSNTHPHVASAIPFSQLDRLPPPPPLRGSSRNSAGGRAENRFCSTVTL